MCDADGRNPSEVQNFRFITETHKKVDYITCSLCASVVMDPKVHALFHFQRGDKAMGGVQQYHGQWSTGLIVIKLDAYGRQMT